MCLVGNVKPIIPAECETDHRLMRMRVTIKALRPQQGGRNVQPKIGRPPKLNVKKLKDPTIAKDFNRG